MTAGRILDAVGPRGRLALAAMVAYGAFEPGEIDALKLHAIIARFEHRFSPTTWRFSYTRFESGLPAAIELRRDLEKLMALGLVLRNLRGRAVTYQVAVDAAGIARTCLCTFHGPDTPAPLVNQLRRDASWASRRGVPRDLADWLPTGRDATHQRGW